MIKESTAIFTYFNFESFLEFFKYIIPLILTVWGVLYLRKSRFYYVERNNIKLYDDIIKKVNGISIKYHNKDINENLILFNGTIVLKSHNDVKSDEIDKELVIFSPDLNAVWKNFSVTNTSVDFEPMFTIKQNKIIIEKTLLKSNDFISFTVC